MHFGSFRQAWVFYVHFFENKRLPLDHDLIIEFHECLNQHVIIRVDQIHNNHILISFPL